MAYRKKTLRSLPPETRKLSRLLGELESVSRRIENLLPRIREIEVIARAESLRRQHPEALSETRTIREAMADRLAGTLIDDGDEDD